MIPRYLSTSDWPRKVADEVNRLLVRVAALEGATAYSVDAVTFTPTTEPTSPTEGLTYMDSTSHKLRTYDGTTWQDHW
jgi:hypothetical protein